jgi:copper oxidase (laccase) domain-containing protein
MSWESTHPTTLGKLYILGKQPRIITDPKISYNQAMRFGADRGKIQQLIVASDSSTDGHKRVSLATYGDPKSWDGAVISESRSAVILQTADCPTLVLTNESEGRVAIVHAGRPALTGDSHVIKNAILEVCGNEDSAKNLKALIVGSICGRCFKHDKPEAKPFIEYFLQLPEPNQVFTDRENGALDLFGVIRRDLLCHGLRDEHIRHEGPCTFETEDLASYRRAKTELRNTMIFVMS